MSMKSGRRADSEIQRRDMRDRDVTRFNRKRPSMLSEFHGKHHGSRDQERDIPDPPHFRSHNRYPHDGSPNISPDLYGNRFQFTPVSHNKLKPDPRGKRMYFPLTSHQSNYRGSHHVMHNHPDSSALSNDGSVDEEIPAKRPCLTVDVSRRAVDPPNSADSAASGTPMLNHVGVSPPAESKSGGLSAYHLEDIDSDDDETLLKDEPPHPVAMATKPQDKPVKTEPSKPSKEELLLMMERVDRDISALETQIATLQKKQRGFGVVRSDAELNELMYELSSKEEAPARYRKTHAVIPPMLVDGEERRSKFVSTNSHVEDMMALHRDLKFTNIWTDEEKAIFREKFVLYPKNFEMIAKFLPNKSPSDCVKFYYLSKKGENFKQLVRKANLKRKKALIKPPELSLSASSLPTMPLSTHPPSLLAAKNEPLTVPEESNKTKPEYGDWSEENISSLKEGLRKFGRAWGKVYREVGGSKTATQCKMFYDDYCSDQSLGLQEALLEHSKMKNAEKLRRKSQSRKPPSTEAKRKTPSKPSPAPVSDGDSENTESASESESNGDGSGSESTVTDSGTDEVITDTVKPTSTKPVRSRATRKASQPLTSPTTKTSEDVVDLFLTAAEALKNNISPEVALHDHTYSLPPSQLVNSVDLQGTSGLSLIAAAAAVVSPNLSRNAGSAKHPGVSPVRAPRGRPPNKYRGGSSNSTVKLSPSLLSPAGGSSANVLLSDIKTTAFRNRTRSAPTDRPKSSTIHIPRSGSTLARMSLSSSSGRTKNMVTPVTYTRQKGDSPSLKSMIALQPPQTATSAFEALVNVAVAAPPAELPKASAGGSGQVLSIRNSVTKKSSANSRGSQSTPSPVNRVTLSRSNSTDSSNSSLNNGTATATAYIDVSEAIKIIASLAQQTPGSSTGSSHTISVIPAQPLFAQSGAPSTIIGSIVTQGASSKQSTATSTSSISVTSNPASVSATVDTLLSHLTSGVNKASPRSTPSPKPSGRTKKTPKTEASKPTTSESTPATGDDLSNLKLLSSLVAAVAATQSSPTTTSSPIDVTTSSSSHTHTTSSTVDLTQTWDHTHSPDSTEHYNNVPPSDPPPSDAPSTDDLPRGVVRPPLSPYPPVSRPSLDHTPSVHRASPPHAPPNSITQSSTDMTASLASIIPTYTPSVGQQSTLLLYTRSRSFPQSVGGDCVPEEEDHLESATRGISELSKLLGTDGNGEPDSPVITAKGHDLAASFLNSADSVDTATNGGSLDRVILNDYSSPAVSESPLKLNLSSLLESRGTVHHTSVPSNHGNSITGDTALNVDAQSR